MYRRHAILNPRCKFESNIVENNVYGTNTCSSIFFSKNRNDNKACDTVVERI